MENKKYYDIRDDMKLFPDAWCYIVYSKRGPGKTYSSLRYMIEENKIFTFIKRTNKDVEFMCAGTSTSKKKIEVNVSPFKPLERDLGPKFAIRAFKIQDGFGAFWRINEEGEPFGNPVGYIISLNAIKDIKGFDLSECDFIIFDEFIPKPWERVRKTEGDSLLDLYMTLQRDKRDRGLGEIKLICLANATSISNPLFITMALVDIAAEMNIKEIAYNYNEYRGIMMHQIISEDPDSDEEKLGIQKAMEGTEWGVMAFGGKFGYNDFSSIGHINLKNYKPVCAFTYKSTTAYIYMKDGIYYACSAYNKKCKMYDLNRENEQKKFYLDYGLDLRYECIDDKFVFDKYSVYDIIINYKEYFKL